MKNFKYLILAIFMILCSALGACGTTPVDDGEKVDDSKLTLRVSNYNGGFGNRWLDVAIERFEEEYKNEQFSNGRVGVQVINTPSKTNYSATIASTSFDVVIGQNVSYLDLSASGDLLPITDIVKDTKLPGEDKTIADKMTDMQNATLTSVGTKDYYLVPHYEFFGGLVYDIDVFNKYKFYFADNKNNGNNGFILTANDKKSTGPDGLYNTSDDGLPATYEEFYKLLEKMGGTDVTPFVWSGEYKDYMNYMLMGLFSAYSGAEEAAYNVTFDSKGKTTKIVTGFNVDGSPVTEEKAITPSTAYLLSQQAGKYYALSFLEKVLSNEKNYHARVKTTSLTHTGAQKLFVEGFCRNEPIAFLVEGNYWYNEAKDQGVFSGLSQYAYSESERHFGWMSLPTRINDSDATDSARKPALVNMTDAYMMINANIKDDVEKVKMAKAFIQFLNTDESLREFTRITGATKAFDYSLTDEDVSSLSDYSASFWKHRENSDVLYTISDNPIFINNQSAFTTNIAGEFWRTKLSNGSTSVKPLELMIGRTTTAKDYFAGMNVNQSDWTSKYGKWF